MCRQGPAGRDLLHSGSAGRLHCAGTYLPSDPIRRSVPRMGGGREKSDRRDESAARESEEQAASAGWLASFLRTLLLCYRAQAPNIWRKLHAPPWCPSFYLRPLPTSERLPHSWDSIWWLREI